MFIETESKSITPIEMIKYIHYDMNVQYRPEDFYVCHATVRKDWRNLNTYPEEVINSTWASKKKMADSNYRKHMPEYEDRFKCTELNFRQDAFYSVVEKCIEDEEEDVFISVNSFFRCRRGKENIRHLNAFVLDYDFHKLKDYEHMSAMEYYQHVKPSLPIEPTFVVSSGRGLHLYFCIEHASKGMSDLYRRIYKRLVNQQKKNHVDPAVSSESQIIRLAGSLNSRCFKTVEILEFHDNRKNIKDIADIVLDYTCEELTEMNKKRAEKVAKKVEKKTVQRVYISDSHHAMLICDDFERLITIRNKNGIYDGYREQLLFHAWEALKFADTDYDLMKNKVLRLNKCFKNPLTEDEVLNRCYPAKPYPHRTSIQTIIDKLGITMDEQMKMQKLRSHSVYESKRQRKKNRIGTLTGRTQFQEEHHQRRLNILKLLFSGNSKKEINEKLHLKEDTLRNDLNKIFGKKDEKGILSEFYDELNEWYLSLKNTPESLIEKLGELIQCHSNNVLNSDYDVLNQT